MPGSAGGGGGGGGGSGRKKKALKMTSQLVIFRDFLISQEKIAKLVGSTKSLY